MSVHFRIRFGAAPNATTIPSFEITAAAAGCPLQPLIFSLRLRHMIHSSIQMLEMQKRQARQEGGGGMKELLCRISMGRLLTDEGLFVGVPAE